MKKQITPLKMLIIFTSCLTILLTYSYFISKPKIVALIGQGENKVWVYDQGTNRCMTFVDPSHSKVTQSCLKLTNHLNLILDYQKLVLGSLLVSNKPKKVLTLGLGGGTLTKQLSLLIPDLTLDLVEINPNVLEAAKNFFSFQETNKIKVHLSDAYDFVSKAANHSEQYDLIIIDLYDNANNYIPPQFISSQFLHMIKNLLSPNGIVAMNTWSNTGYYQLESNLFRQIFGEFYNLQLPNSNRVIISSNSKLPPMSVIEQRADKLETEFQKFNIKKDWLLKLFILDNKASLIGCQ